MTTPTPTGRLRPTDAGHDLVLVRTLPGPIEDAWAAVTDPDRTARWIGRWEGDGAPGATVRLQLGFEESSPWSDVTITECAAPRRLRVRTEADGGPWDLSIDLDGAGDASGLSFVMHGVDPAAVGEIGPGWEYYLDQLVASMSGAPLPRFEDYYPAQREYFAAQAR